MTSDILTLLSKRGEEVFCSPINRLDKPVEGIVIFAKNSKIASLLSKTQYDKYYYALVLGKLDRKSPARYPR